MANERIDEFKGSVKEGAGKLTDDPQLEAEGRGEKNIAKAERTIKGVGDQVKGAIEQGVGKVTGDHESHAQGKVDSAKGDIERTG